MSTIAIISAWGRGYGTGHIQRMASLLWHLNANTDIRAMLLAEETPWFFGRDLAGRVMKKPDGRIDLIIRDMRDSTEEEIEALQRIAPVLSIDDQGSGRQRADFIMDMLPDPRAETPQASGRTFIYGYTFMSAMLRNRGKRFDKTIDAAVYPGADSTAEYRDLLLSLLPEDSSYALCAGDASIIAEKGTQVSFDASSFAQVLCSCRLLLSHFGILLYEAHACGCALAAVNPGGYHSRLCDIAPRELAVQNLGIRDTLDVQWARGVIKGLLSSHPAPPVAADHVCDIIRENLDSFCRYLKSILPS
jgi:hypothetical protein